MYMVLFQLFFYLIRRHSQESEIICLKSHFLILALETVCGLYSNMKLQFHRDCAGIWCYYLSFLGDLSRKKWCLLFYIFLSFITSMVIHFVIHLCAICIYH